MTTKRFVHIPSKYLVSKEVLLKALQEDTSITNGTYTTKVCMNCGSYEMNQNAPFPSDPTLVTKCKECFESEDHAYTE